MFRYTKPETFADCVGDELPLGWEEVIDPSLGVYYIDHINRKWPLVYDTCAGLVCLLYTSPSPRDRHASRMPSSA